MRINVSIVGDSISTYVGYNPQGYAVFYNTEMCRKNGLDSVYDTWWAKVNQNLEAYLCVNNSYSGSTVAGEKFPAASCDVRLSNLHTNMANPDIILIYLGINDFAQGIEVFQKRKFMKDINSFEGAYKIMIKRMKKNYPDSMVVCGTLMKTFIKNREDWVFPESYAGHNIEEYNEIIRKLALKGKCMVADLAKEHWRYETLDGTHPTAEGHMTIAQAWISCMRKMKLSYKGQNL